LAIVGLHALKASLCAEKSEANKRAIILVKENMGTNLSGWMLLLC